MKPSSLLWSLAASAALAVSGSGAYAKDAPLSAVALYDGANGPAYVLISDIQINQKAELRSCGSSAPRNIDKSTYNDAPKVFLAAGETLDYTADSGLSLTKDGISICVAPSNVKFDKNASMTPAEIASRGALTARLLPDANGAVDPLPPWKPGLKIVFVATPDVELGEYLRSDRAANIAVWRAYLSKYGTSSHAPQAKDSLGALLAADGQASFATFAKSTRSFGPYPDLQRAKSSADQALALSPGNSAAAGVNTQIYAELSKLTDQGRSELDAYKKALAAHTAGYLHLTTAVTVATSVVGVDPHFAPGVALQTDAYGQAGALDSSLKSAEAAMAARKFDDAYAAVTNYLSFKTEIPRVNAVIDATYRYHFDRAHELGDAQDWDGSLKELQRAADIKQTNDVVAALRNVQVALQASHDKAQADVALQQSTAFGQQQQYIQAYEMLDNLPPGAHDLVAAELQRLQPMYIQNASTAAKQIQQAHDPIRGIADETEIVRAYGYLRRASALSNDPILRDRTEVLAGRLSDYYLVQARHYMDKPLGSGAGVAWSYLQKALAYKAGNVDSVRDAITQSSAAYQMRSKLSIRVLFRDQTSRRDSAGFADQLADAIATGLETSGLPVRVVRPGDTPQLEPNFQLIGDVIDHRRTMVPTSVPKDSTYRAGEQDVPNDAWNQANRDYEAAGLALQTDQTTLQVVISKGKKKDIEDATDRVTADQKKVASAHATVDSIPKTVASDIVKPYTYTENTIDLSAAVQLQYRINDAQGNAVEAAHPVSREAKQKFTILENVKPEDTQGVKARGTVPDDLQFLTDVENSTRDELIGAVRKSVAALPDKVLAQAKRQVQDGDVDGAAESYILYLNATPPSATPDRQAAQQFLQQQFNIQPAASTAVVASVTSAP
jgi:hypothetical protein